MQGEVIARNLAARRETERVTLADLRAPAGPMLSKKCVRIRADALDPGALAKASRKADAAILAVPSAIARESLANLIDAGVPTVDISFTPEPPLDLDRRARRSRVPVVLDCGLAPGLSHILAAAAHRELGGLDSLRIYVGGVPQSPPEAFRHAVYFNARDLLDEYIRPARMRRRGRNIAPHPLDAPVESHRHTKVGRVEAFPSDGLRTLLTSFTEVRDMAELTLRHPGHLEAMRSLRAAGLLEGDQRTDALATSLGALFPSSGFPDRVVMDVRGRRGGRERRFSLHAVQEKSGNAMARTTGFTGAAAAVLLARGEFSEPGVHPPERLGDDPRLTAAVLADLGSRGILVERRGALRWSATN